MMSQADK